MHMAQQIMPHMLQDTPAVSNNSSREAAAELEKLWKAQDGLGDTWEDGALRDVARYLLGAKGLKVPPRFAWLVPSDL